MQDHAQIELYITISDEQQSKLVEETLDSLPLDKVVAGTLKRVGVMQQVMLTLLITDDAGIQEMNQQYRQQNTPTDVLSFPLLDRPLVAAPTDQLWQPREDAGQVPEFVTPPEMVMNLGDIVMSWPTLVKQAAAANHRVGYELLYLLSHGVLHLVGFDDHSEAGYQAMIQVQQAVLQEVGQKQGA